MNGSSDDKYFAEFMTGGILLEAKIEGTAEEIRELSKHGYKQELMDARIILMSVFAKLLIEKGVAPDLTTETSAHRLLMLIAFVQGIPVTESLISEGQYIKATAVLKQDYEFLTRMREINAGAAKTGKTPNVKHAPEGSQKFYSDLNKVAHPSNPTLIAQLLRVEQAGDAIGLSHIPHYFGPTSNSLYELHVWLLLEITREAILLFLELYKDTDLSLFRSLMTSFDIATDLLQQAGFIVVLDNES